MSGFGEGKRLVNGYGLFETTTEVAPHLGHVQTDAG